MLSRLFATLCLLFAVVTAHAATVPVGFNDRQIATGFTSPTALTVLPDGRVLAMQQNGIIRIVKGDVLLAANFWGVPNVDSTNERGCLGIVPDPQFATNHFVYIYCTITNGTASNNRIIRVTEANDTIVAGSNTTIFQLPNVPSATRWHMGGALRFGVDGKLYVAVGNHEDNPQPVASASSQNLASAFGKILRINKDGTIPSDNPYFSTSGAYQAIWNIGYRNPFAFDIQPVTGRMFVGDVGQGTWEEVNDGVRAGNYGWPAFEGPETNASYNPPFYAYNHSTGGCAITGVAFYNPATAQFPSAYVGKFLFQDFCQGTIRTLDPANAAVANFVSGISFPTNLALASDGSLYYMARNQQTGNPNPGGGTLSKITYTGSQVPRITLNPLSQTIVIGDPVTFRVAADGATSYQWQRNGANISGATATTYAIAATVAGDNNARFRALATNSFGSAFSAEATLTVTSNHFPVAAITLPSASTEFSTGDVISYSGTGTDVEDGNLPGSAFTWQVDFQHDSHQHPFIAATTGSTAGSFTVPSFETEANVWLRIYLTVRDSGGQTHTVSRDIFPARQVSSLTPVGTPVNGWGPIEKDRSNGEAAAGDGRPMIIGGIPFQKGLGVHAPSDVRFNLGGTCTGNFISDIGVDDETGDAGSVVFQVYLDNVLAFDSGVKRGTDPRASLSVSVAGKNELRLVVTNAGDTNGNDHADWAAARITGCTGAPPPLSITNLSAKDTTNAADWSIQTNLQIGNNVYGDRTFTFTAIPGVVAGAAWIRPANDSKTYAGNPAVTFSISAAADVYVALNDAGPRPSWVDATWTDTAVNLDTRESATQTRTYSIFRKRFNAGQVALGPWNNGASMYLIAVR
jgi:glucose/arabinose dehydrogenase